MRSLLLLFPLLLLANNAVEAASLRCNSKLISTGDTTSEVLERCGEPVDRSFLGYKEVVGDWGMRAEVTVLGHSLSKKDDGLRFGAVDYRATGDPNLFKELRNRFDLILNTVSVNLDMDKYLSLLRLNGTLVELGLPEHPLTVRAFSLGANNRALAGSNVGGIAETQEMLDFCAEHGIGAEIELISAEQINDAYERVVASDVRYRFVIDAATI